MREGIGTDMAVSLNPRAERLLVRLRRVSVYSALELLLLVLIAVQCARLFWTMLTPLGPIGDYKALDRMRAAAAPGPALGAFDPFFRQVPDAAQQPAVVTSLDIRLYGVTANQATGMGSAIIGTREGEQRSFLVGEEIMPGVTLEAVGFDFVTISRGGQSEQLFLDQTPAATQTPGGSPAVPQSQLPQVQLQPAPPASPPPTPAPQPPAPPPQSLKVNP